MLDKNGNSNSSFEPGPLISWNVFGQLEENMSIICQNFVQNAWKKDLCSNCFKSVGDHCGSQDAVPDTSIANITAHKEQNDKTKPNTGRCVANAGQVCQSRSNVANVSPHITWKSLNSEKNVKNSQPFRLDTGFRGRLLTINNITDKNAKTSLTNGGTSDSLNSKNVSNGKNEEKVHRTEENAKSRSRSSNGLMSMTNGDMTPPPSILKRCKSPQSSSPKKSPRRSTVGFKEEDPVVIGYGGRDFTPEELEWEMSSDWESGSALECLDETEEDKVMSKITRKNTEFNSDTSNLLEKCSKNSATKSSVEEKTGTRTVQDVINQINGNSADLKSRVNQQEMKGILCKQKNEGDSGKIITTNCVVISDKDSSNNKTLNKNQKGNLISGSSKKEENRIKEKSYANGDLISNGKKGKCVTITQSKQEAIGEASEQLGVKSQINVNADVSKQKDFVKSHNGVSHNENRSKSDPDYDFGNRSKVKESKNNLRETCVESDSSRHEEAVCISKGIQSTSLDSFVSGDKVVSTEAESVYVTDAKDENTVSYEKGAGVDERGSKGAVKNSSIRGFSCSSHEAEVCGGDSDSPPSCHLGCLSDNLRSWDDSIINQAINPSVTNGCITYDGNMSDECRLSMASPDRVDNDSTPSYLNNPSEEENCLVTSEAKELSTETEGLHDQPFCDADENTEQEKCNLGKPRISFLHGMKEESRESSLPSAIYSPASDLFVSRHTSSSSSDECEQSEVTLTAVTDDKTESDELSDESKDESNAAHLLDDQLDELSNTGENKSEVEVSCPVVTAKKRRPEIPGKPSKPHPKINRTQTENPYAIPLPFPKVQHSISYGVYDNYVKTDKPASYFVANATSNFKKVPLVTHYAESNIYQEINNAELAFDQEDGKKGDQPGAERESKLAALAVELEQVRCTSNNIKRQAPAPPKLNAIPGNDSLNSASQNPSPIDSQLPVQIVRSDSIPFSSSSSTASSSSQDTDLGYSASWNLHSDLDTQPKSNRSYSSSKSKSSFLLNQYSKCKMLALGYVDDASGKSKKKFSLKKLLKIGKESDGTTSFDSSYPNPKAWKYSENFDRPRAKLEIIHPMDLEDKNVTVNPGFHSIHMSSVGSFASPVNSMDSLPNRLSSFSDYDSVSSEARVHDNPDYKSDGQDSGDFGMDYYRTSSSNGQTNPEVHTPQSDNSGSSSPPSPSRLSTASLSSTTTSGSSKIGIPVRPPKPPPPPRAHSLLPGNRNGRSSNGVCKEVDSLSNPEVNATEQLKPQAPKRQYRQGVKSDYANFEAKSEEIEQQDQGRCLQSEKLSTSNSSDENEYECVKSFVSNEDIGTDSKDQDTALVYSENTDLCSNVGNGMLNTVVNNKELASNKTENDKSLESREKTHQSSLQRNKHPPLTKAPSRPPPIYAKSQYILNAREKPWKSLEGSYAALATNNREILQKLIAQEIKSRPNLLQIIQRTTLQWENFQLDTERPAVVFAFGDKVIYDAILTCKANFLVTLVISCQQQNSGLGNCNQFKYPVLGHFNSYIPNKLLSLDSPDSRENAEVQASICVLNRAEVTTIENFIEDLPDKISETQERELCFIMLQLINGLKCLQAQGTEAIDASFQNLILVKTQEDDMHTLVFLPETFFDDADNAYTSVADNSKVSLCQYALMLLCQLKKALSAEALVLSEESANPNSSKVFRMAVEFLTQEKAVSLSQTKTLLECYLWGIYELTQDEGFEPQDYDVILHRWMDIERSNFIKSIIGNSLSRDFTSLDEIHSQFLVRTNVRTIKEVVSFR